MRPVFSKVVNFLDGECHRLLNRARFFNVLTEQQSWNNYEISTTSSLLFNL